MHSPAQDPRTGIRVSHSPTLLVLVLAFVIVSNVAEDVPHHSCAAVGEGMLGPDCLLSFEEADHEKLCEEKASSRDEICKLKHSKRACQAATADHDVLCQRSGAVSVWQGSKTSAMELIETGARYDPGYWSDPDNNCRDPSIPAPAIYIDKYAGFRCSNGTSHADAGDKQACAEAAAAASHAFMSFNSMTSACESTSACSVRTEADGWNVHKRWRGAFNATHADEIPACDGPVVAGEWYSNRCATQVTLPDGGRNDKTCTSCEPDNAFVMLKVASRTGKCEKYDTATKVLCADLTSDRSFDPSAATGKMCTKFVEAQLYLPVESMQDEGARAHYTSVMGGLWGSAIPKCQVRKETACGADGSCDVQKTVQCVEVCKLTDSGDWKPPWPVSDCSAALCNGTYGELACQGAAMME